MAIDQIHVYILSIEFNGRNCIEEYLIASVESGVENIYILGQSSTRTVGMLQIFREHEIFRKKIKNAFRTVYHSSIKITKF